MISKTIKLYVPLEWKKWLLLSLKGLRKNVVQQMIRQKITKEWWNIHQPKNCGFNIPINGISYMCKITETLNGNACFLFINDKKYLDVSRIQVQGLEWFL